ncbi:MAG: GWxTD domain-containing protein [Acidobacteria bacterium]|nr:GWxTD domain-containing protein [Acidobacteriota bacterium]
MKLLALLGAAFLLLPGARAQESPSQDKDKQPPLADSLPKREMGEKEKKKRERELLRELESPFRTWLEEDVVYIITPEEKEAFLHLNTGEEREQFIEQFWLRRDPTPDTVENENKEEHYRRIAYTNERFASGVPGWTTDRGRIYIAWGPPDSIESHPGGGPHQRPMDEGGGFTSTYPFEVWRYRYLEGMGLGQEVILEFVDDTMTGEYRLATDPASKDALLYLPNAGLTLLEQMGMARKRDRFGRRDATRVGVGLTELGNELAALSSPQPFERFRTYAAIMAPPPAKFLDLEELVTTRVKYNLLPFEMRFDFFRVTDETILVPVTVAIKKKDVAFTLENGVHHATVNVFGRVTTLGGRIVQTFEDVIRLDVPESLLEQTLAQAAVYQKALPLRPGLYKLNLAVKDLNTGNVGSIEERLAVPRFEEDRLAHGSLVLADQIERVTTNRVGAGQFVIGDTKVRPMIGEIFAREDRMGIYLQVYNLGINEQTHKPDALIEYSVRKGDQILLQHSETTDQLEKAGRQITLERVLPLGGFEPGQYKLEVKITDRVRQQTIAPAADFRIRSN